jgi:hypothetical protein
VFTNTYASRPFGGAAQCGAGEETFLRVVTLTKPATETFSLRVESCWFDAELGDGGIQWDPTLHVVSADFLFAPNDPKPKGPQRYAVEDDGTAVRLGGDAMIQSKSGEQ